MFVIYMLTSLLGLSLRYSWCFSKLIGLSVQITSALFSLVFADGFFGIAV